MDGNGNQSLPIGDVLTEPMSLSRLAWWFGTHRDSMRNAIRDLKGVRRFGGLYRVPVIEMPPGYLLDAGLIEPTALPKDAES